MQTKWVAFAFNRAEWGSAVKGAVASIGMADLAKLMDVSVTTINRWCRGDKAVDSMPSMTNFLLMCNLMDINPAMFFTTEE